MRYTIVVEKAGNNYSAYVPDLPGCVATGSTIEETEREIREAIGPHIDGMMEDGLPIPQSTSFNTLEFGHNRTSMYRFQIEYSLVCYARRLLRLFFDQLSQCLTTQGAFSTFNANLSFLSPSLPN